MLDMRSMIVGYGRLVLCISLISWICAASAVGDAIPDESLAAALSRHQRVAARRSDTQIICHRGAVEFAHENTLEAYRAAFDLGADGNEIDIRATKDGVLVCFHDDMLDGLLEAYGDVSDYRWATLRQFRFRDPGPFREQCRIPTLVEVFELHRKHAGLLHLDIKRPELIEPVMRLVDRMDMWDQVVNAPSTVVDSRLKRNRYKAGLYLDRADVDAKAILSALEKPGDSVMVEDPRGVAIALGRTIRRPSEKPVLPIDIPHAQVKEKTDQKQLLSVLRDAADWNQVASGQAQEKQSATRILARARAADAIAELGITSDEALKLLHQRVLDRSLHRDWRYNGLDGAAAFRAMIRLHARNVAGLARFCLWRDDPRVEAVSNPEWKNPRSWTDWRTKIIVFRELAKLPGIETEQVCRDYLALSDEAAQKIGMPQFEEAARALLSVSPTEMAAIDLMKHRRSDVRGRAILFCVANADQAWANHVLAFKAPHALAYVIPRTPQTGVSSKSVGNMQ
jgi:glycerophosphoryl diester phosphodiesterase